MKRSAVTVKAEDRDRDVALGLASRWTIATFLYAYSQPHVLHISTRNRTLAILDAQLLSLTCVSWSHYLDHRLPGMKMVAHVGDL